MVNVGIIGISGYSGKLILKLLLNHPKVRVTYIAAETTTGKIEDIHPEFFGQIDLTCAPFDLKMAQSRCDLCFLSVPHTKSMNLVPGLLNAKKRIVDLSADYRFSSAVEYKKYYAVDHSDKKNLAHAVYGLPELYREEIKKANLIANPGCYPTAGILALAPLAGLDAKNIDSIIIDAKSGVTGAGRKATLALMYGEVNENLKAYKVLTHQHTPEINTELSKLAEKTVSVTFVPHLVPLNQGILETIYVSLKKPLPLAQIHKIYKNFYKTEQFVRVLNLGSQPEVKNVLHTNFCDIGFALNEKMLVITCAIDNLMKGASGQAVQNMNIMCGFPENLGLMKCQ